MNFLDSSMSVICSRLNPIGSPQIGQFRTAKTSHSSIPKVRVCPSFGKKLLVVLQEYALGRVFTIFEVSKGGLR